MFFTFKTLRVIKQDSEERDKYGNGGFTYNNCGESEFKMHVT